jgi:hypothetical protein
MPIFGRVPITWQAFPVGVPRQPTQPNVQILLFRQVGDSFALGRFVASALLFFSEIQKWEGKSHENNTVFGGFAWNSSLAEGGGSRLAAGASAERGGASIVVGKPRS